MMHWFHNLKIRTKILSIVAISVIGVSILYLLIAASINTLGQLQDRGYQLSVDAVLAKDAESASSRLYTIIADAVINRNYTENQQVWENAKEAELNLLKSIDDIVDTKDEKTAIAVAEDVMNQYISIYENEMLPLLQANADSTVIAQYNTKLDTLRDQYETQMTKVSDSITLESQNGDSLFDVEKAHALQLFIIIIVVALIILAIWGIYIAQKISVPIKKAQYMIEEMRLGHFSTRLKMTTRDEIGQIAMSMDKLSDDLQNVVIGTMNQISEGNVSSNIETRDEMDEIAPALKKTIETIRSLIAETTMLSQAAVAGKWDVRGNADAFNGGYKEVVEGVNATLNTMSDKIIWYESLLDSVPFPISVTDLEMNWTFINKPVETFLGVKRKDILGQQCSNWNAAICKTEDCGVVGLRRGKLETYFKQQGHNFQVNTAYISNGKGEKVGHVEVVQDITAQTKIVDYQIVEIERLASNLINLSKGNLTMDMNIEKGDNYTAEVSLQFNKIGATLNEVKHSIENLINDTTMLAQAGIDGKLDTRADASKHQGDFAKIVDGINATLDAVVAPIQEASTTLKELAQGNLNTGMIGNYQGDYTLIKDDMNQTISFLKRYVSEITLMLEQIGQGNLNQHIDDDYLGDFQAIKTALNDITNNLSATMTDINIAAGQVEIGSHQISDGGQALSQGTTEQASAIQELTASIEEIAGETKKNANNANQANELVMRVRTNAEVSNDQMNKMVIAMTNINESSKNISKIIKVIDDIAFQTNILALNAAVEAARAGQHGKGFAVVAEEVRTLAARSAEAAKETTGLIEDSIDNVDSGTKIADDTEASLKEILHEIEQVTDLVGSIARASNDQASEIAQITKGIEQVSQVVQTNSATAEESAAASEELSGQAEMVKQMIDAFKIKDLKTQQSTPQAANFTAEPSSNASLPEPIINLDDVEDKY